MRYYLSNERGGVLAVIPATGGQAPDGTLFDAPEQRTFVKTGEAAFGRSWRDLLDAAMNPGYIDV